jgi:RNA polymerase sigma factor (sigma-70 family)
MTAARLPPAVRDLLRLAPDAVGPDADLLARFVRSRDEAAFAALVRRHGATVWDVCQSVLRNRADADDAFQAVFLTLARRAVALRKPASVGAWLHGVAVRVARKALRTASRRRATEAEAPPPTPPDPAGPNWAEVRAAVHEALAALPAAYRDPLVSCYLRGLTQDAAAAELGLSKAAVKKRLERGRDRLRAVLIRRGFGPAVVLAVDSVPAAAVPGHLLDAAPRLAAGAEPVPNSILRLVEGGVAMPFAKLGAVFGVVAAVGVALAAGPGDAPPRPAVERPPAVGPKRVTVKEPEAKRIPAPPDLAALEGAWLVTRIETAGEALYEANSKWQDEYVPPPLVAFSGNRAVVKNLRVLFVRDFTFTLEPRKAPKEMDVTFLEGPMTGRTFEGIYVLRGDELRICLRLQHPEHGRPKGFVTNSGTTLYTFILARVRTLTPPAAAAAAVGAAPPAVNPQFDAVLRSGNTLYFVLDRPQGEDFRDQLAAVGARLDAAARTLDRVPDQGVGISFFLRTDPKAAEGSWSGFTRTQVRDLRALPADRRADKLLEHAWTRGRLPKDAVPLPPPRESEPLPPRPAGAVPLRADDQPVLTTEGLARLVTERDGNPARAAGRVVEFAGTVVSVGKGVDGATVPLVRIEGWAAGENLYGRVFVHNVPADRAGRAGDRVRVRGRVVSHGYGTLTLWSDRWTREEAAPPAERSPKNR